MNLISSNNLVADLSHTDLYIDANEFKAFYSYPDLFGPLVGDLKSNGCQFITIPSVLFEFSRGSDNVEDYNKRVEFVESLCRIYPIERHFQEFEDFIPVLQRLSGGASYSDFLLCSCLYKFQTPSFLMTENYKDIPTPAFDRVHLITLDNDKEFRTHAIYKLNRENLARASQEILRTS